jgi:predicted nucleotidyltransferase
VVDAALRKLILDYVRALADRGVRVERVVLFGSRAVGTARDDSDVDLAIVSPDFGRDRHEEGTLLHQAAWRIDPRIEPVPVSSAAWRDDDWVPLIHELRTRGVVIYPAA